MSAFRVKLVANDLNFVDVTHALLLLVVNGKGIKPVKGC